MIVFLTLIHYLSRVFAAPIDTTQTADCSSVETRSTRDIIVSCFVTLLACTWTALHHDVKTGMRDGVGERTGTVSAFLFLKVPLFFLAILLPEVIAGWAVAQSSKAGQLVKTIRNWRFTKTHAFFVIMGGIKCPVGDGDTVLRPHEFENLVHNRGIDALQLPSEREIEDKSKSDWFGKMVAIFQILWFIIQCIARGVERLPLTELELITLSYTVLSFTIYLAWWHKPSGVECPILLRIPPVEGNEISGVIEVSNKGDKRGGATIERPDNTINEIRRGVDEDGKENVGSLSETNAKEENTNSRRGDDVVEEVRYEEGELPRDGDPTPTSDEVDKVPGTTVTVPDNCDKPAPDEQESTRDAEREEALPEEKKPPPTGGVDEETKLDESFLRTENPLKGPDQRRKPKPKRSWWALTDTTMFSVRIFILVNLLGCIFAAIHLIGWDFHFRSTKNQRLWRASSLVLLLFNITGACLALYGKFVSSRFTSYLVHVVFVLLNFLISLLILLYIPARIITIYVMFHSLVALSPEVLVDIKWARLIPHI